MFIELYEESLDKLQDAFKQFKESVDFKILKADINRQEKLNEVMIEGKILTNE